MKKFYILMAALSILNSVTAQSCLPEGITFSSQAKIDNFITNYPNCTAIEGSVTIQGGDITNLNGLRVVTSIGSDLRFGFNAALTSLTGLEGITFIGGSLSIDNNDALTNLTGLDNLTSIGGSLSISNNYHLIRLTGLDNLNSIGGDLFIGYNDALTNLSGLNNINIESIGDLYIIENNSLSTCNEQIICDYLASPNGSVNIYKNATGCNSPIEVANACGITLPCLPFGNYYFFSQADIDNFQTAFPNCTALQGNITISGSDITNLLGLDSLTSIGGEFNIWGNNVLTSLTGLENLTSIGGRLMIGSQDYGGNASLTSLTGLDNVAPSSITYLSIKYNLSLSDCAVQSICDYLVNPNVTVTINNNVTGCNSQAEVEAACVNKSVDNKANDNTFSIYPNPSSTEVTIESTTKGQLSILNLSGQQFITRLITEPKSTIDISKLTSGVYVVRVTGKRTVQVGKFVKQ